jgi:hypothetical protein
MGGIEPNSKRWAFGCGFYQLIYHGGGNYKRDFSNASAVTSRYM